MWKLNPSSPRSRYACEMDKTFYQRYCCAKTRCNNKNRKQYKDYWWRGIRFMRDNFDNFYDDMYDSYVLHYNKYWRNNTTLDRINVNWNYCKENCKWSTRKEQQNNTTKNSIFTIEWETKNISERMNITWFSFVWFKNRYTKLKEWKISIEDFFDKNYSTQKTYYQIWDKKYSILDLSKITWLWRSSIRARYKKYLLWKLTEKELLEPISWKKKELVDKITINWKMYSVQYLSEISNTSRDNIKKRYNKYINNEIDLVRLINKFNLNF